MIVLACIILGLSGIILFLVSIVEEGEVKKVIAGIFLIILSIGGILWEISSADKLIKTEVFLSDTLSKHLPKIKFSSVKKITIQTWVKDTPFDLMIQDIYYVEDME